MNKNKLKDNVLIKKKSLAILLKERGIKRIKPSAFALIEKEAREEIVMLAEKAKGNMIINGRKTLMDEDIRAALSIRKERTFEI
jgi:histone H3/H4